MFRALIITIALAAASSISVQGAHAQSAETKAQQAVQALARDSQDYDAIVMEGMETAMAVIQRIEETNQMASRRAKKAEVDAWSASWIPETRAKFDRLEQRLKALPPVDTTGFSAFAEEGDQDLADIRAVAASVAESSRESLASARELFEIVAQNAPKAAVGDSRAMQGLGLATFQSMRNMLVAENRTLKRAMPSVGQDHPQYWLMSSNVNSNEVLVEALTATLAEARGQTVDLKSASQRAQRFVDAARQDARRSQTEAQKVLRGFSEDPALASSDFGKQIATVLVTYRQSRDVELKLCDELAKFIRSAQAGGSFLDAFADGVAAVEGLVDERIKLDAARRNILAQ